ncbi:peptidase [Pontibacillus halophilus JSM 076056 = DSM 19796]|uniref:Peptidase n=1 Tax=Pontibacillus halophilus JSM 076056 = DSM 19796 TaxID=1385510 RepID=A0A0A5GLH4_9BACI|nr:DUF4397 domain-containing protein [Pontibacillus halophilus]KGX91985.1 peptidase [Pontibacillus halophilus JSM 076056 = DSM 19796]
MSYNQEEYIVLQAAKYEMLADYYKFMDPRMHCHYYMKYVECVQQLAHMHHHGGMGHVQGSGYGQQPYNRMSTSKVRVFHASPNAPAVDVYINGQMVLRNVSFGQISDYVDLPAGDYRIEVKPTGQISAVITESVRVPGGGAFTVAAVGNVEDISLLTIPDDVNGEQGKAKVRFTHLSPDAPRVDIAVKGGDVLFSNVGFKESTDYITLPPTKVDLEVRPAGSKQVVLTVPDVRLKAGEVYNAVAIGYLNGTPSLEATFI